MTITDPAITAPAPNTPAPAAVQRTVCPTFADVTQLLRQYSHQATCINASMPEREQARHLINDRITAAHGPTAGAVVVASHQGQLLAFTGDICAADGLGIEFTCGARAPLHRLVAVGLR